MGEVTGIGWTDHTFNPWVGCTAVSPACDRCYAKAWAARIGQPELWEGKRRLTSDANWREPVKWNRVAGALGIRSRVFTASLADVFDTEVSDDWRDKLFALIDTTLNLDWQVLTKRPKVMRDYLARSPLRRNVWAGTTVENQDMLVARLPYLRDTRAAVHFLSVEPMLGPMLLGPSAQHVDWVICGGESGPGARPMNPAWPRALRDECADAGIAFFFKQWGGLRAKSGGKDLDGAQHCAFPTVGAD